MRPVGPDVPPPISALLKEMQDAIRALQVPGKPVLLPHVALKTDLPSAEGYPERAILCDEINSLVVSTLVSGAYAWKRADGGSL
jgi:hypothetical protein